nr:hypothetical protein Iba_chr12cCG9920 [Ipomoea batatas]GMD68093.1 hypothetical protein Iba_chr12dCG5850 [Ipomoea batatas]
MNDDIAALMLRRHPFLGDPVWGSKLVQEFTRVYDEYFFGLVTGRARLGFRPPPPTIPDKTHRVIDEESTTGQNRLGRKRGKTNRCRLELGRKLRDIRDGNPLRGGGGGGIGKEVSLLVLY